MMTKMNFRKVLAMVMGIIMCCSGIGMNATCYAADTKGTVSELTDPVWGDTNCDGTPCELADVILIMQYYCCPDRYGLGKEEGVTEQGMLNADVYRNGDGLTLMDALMIQKYMLGIITELPYSYLNPSPVTTETTSTTTTTTTTSTTTSQPTTTSTTSTTTTTTTSKPTTTSTTSTTTTTTTSKPTTTSTTSTTTTSTTSSTTTTSTTSISTSEISTVSYYYETYVEDDGTVYYLNEDGELLGPDSEEHIYNGLINTAKKYGFNNYKIVYSDQIIPYSYVIPSHHDVTGLEAWQIVPIEDLKYICPESYAKYVEEDYLKVYEYVFWRPKETKDCFYSCGNEHYEVYKNSEVIFTIHSFWQLIPTDSDENDILKLASDSSSSSSLHISADN